MLKKIIKIPAPIVIVILVALIYSNVFTAPFIFDDLKYIVDNTFIRDINNFSVLSGTRYLVFLSFALNYAAGGLSPLGYHIVNIALHAINAVLVYALVRSLFLSPAMAGSGPGQGEATATVKAAPYVPLITALVFAAHPMETEAVSYISQRFASMAAFFYLLSVTAYVRSRLSSMQGRGRVALAFYLVAFLGGILGQVSKETSFTLPATILLTEFLFFQRARFSIRALRTALPFVALFGVIPVQLFHPFGGGPGGIAQKLRLLQIEELATLSRHDYLATQFRVILTYIRLLFLPFGQRGDYDYAVYHSFFTAPVFLSLVFLLVVLVIAVFTALRSARSGKALGLLAAFGIIWFFITISVESSIIPIKDVIFEHRVYLPSAGVFMALIALYSSILARRGRLPARVALIPPLVVVVALSALTYRRNMVWRSGLVFWQDVAKKSPKKARGHNNLGNALYNRSRVKDAMREYEEAISLNRDYYEAYNNLGTALLETGRPAEALLNFRRAMDLRPDYAPAYSNAALALVAMNEPLRAARYARSALALRPGLVDAHSALGMALVDLGKTNEGIGHLKEATRLAPSSKNIWKNLGLALRRAGRRREAEKALEKSR